MDNKEIKNNNEISDTEVKKKRKTINVSLQKRNHDLLNGILNQWESEGYNISNEVCEAIIFKNKTSVNPHICTILSTLSLIESSIRSQKISKEMTEEDIDNKVLEIFNEVITIDIDGAKLTSLLKNVNSVYSNENYSNKEILDNSNTEKQIKLEQVDNTDEQILTRGKSIDNNLKDIEKEITVDNKSSENTIVNKPIVWSSFPEENINNKQTNNLFSNFAENSEFTV